MNNNIDELTKDLARSVTRRQALKKFGVGIVAAFAASLGLRTAVAPGSRHGYYATDFSGSLVLCVDPTTCQSGPYSRGGKAVTKGPYMQACGLVLDLGTKCTF